MDDEVMMAEPPVGQPEDVTATVGAELIHRLVLFGILVKDFILGEGLEVLEEGPPLPQLLANVHGITECLIPDDNIEQICYF